MNRNGDLVNRAIAFAILALLIAVPLAGAKVTANQTIGYGWNFIGIPPNSDPITPADSIRGLEGVTVLWSADKNLMYDPAMPDSINTFQMVNPGEVFWVYISNPEKQTKTVAISSEASEVKLTLHPGENYIFTPFYMREILCSKLAQDIKGVRIIHTYNTETAAWLIYDPAMPEFLDDFLNIRAGTAYRIFVDYPTDQILNLEVENPKIIIPPPEVNDSVPIVFGVSDGFGQTGETVDVLVNITSQLEEPIASVILDLGFNHSVINLSGVENGNLNSDWSNPGFDADGKVVLVYHGNGTELTGNFSGTIATLKFKVLESSESESSINISSMLIGNTAYDFGSVAIGTNGTIRR